MGRPCGGMARERSRAPSQGAADHREAGGCSHVRAVRVNRNSRIDPTPTASRSLLGGGTRIWPPYAGAMGWGGFALQLPAGGQWPPLRRAGAGAPSCPLSGGCRPQGGWVLFQCQSGPGQQELPQRSNPHRFAEPPVRGAQGSGRPAARGRAKWKYRHCTGSIIHSEAFRRSAPEHGACGTGRRPAGGRRSVLRTGYCRWTPPPPAGSRGSYAG